MPYPDDKWGRQQHAERRFWIDLLEHTQPPPRWRRWWWRVRRWWRRKRH